MKMVAQVEVEYEANTWEHEGKDKLLEERKSLSSYLSTMWPGDKAKIRKLSVKRLHVKTR